MTHLSGIIERLEKATGPDRELDEAIVRSLCPNAIIETYVQGDEEKTVFHAEPLVENKRYVPQFTSSIDAALTLVPEGWTWRVASCCVSDDAWVMPDFNHPVYGERLKSEWPDECQRDPLMYLDTDVDLRPPGRPAIALCIATLKGIAALRARANKGKG